MLISRFRNKHMESFRIAISLLVTDNNVINYGSQATKYCIILHVRTFRHIVLTLLDCLTTLGIRNFVQKRETETGILCDIRICLHIFLQLRNSVTEGADRRVHIVIFYIIYSDTNTGVLSQYGVCRLVKFP